MATLSKNNEQMLRRSRPVDVGGGVGGGADGEGREGVEGETLGSPPPGRHTGKPPEGAPPPVPPAAPALDRETMYLQALQSAIWAKGGQVRGKKKWKERAMYLAALESAMWAQGRQIMRKQDENGQEIHGGGKTNKNKNKNKNENKK